MRRKIAFSLTAVLTLALMIARIFAPSAPLLADILIVVTILAYVAIAVLSYVKDGAVAQPQGGWYTAVGWITTFCGAVLIMSVVYDAFCWLVYGQIPPPNQMILNRTDHITLICTILFGLTGGAFLIMRGFWWMAHSDKDTTLTRWLSLAPVLWMWFRLARYEVSYASTIDITESYFDFALLVFVSLFFLSFARATARVGAKQKNALLIFSLCAGMIAVSGALTTFAGLADGQPLSTLLIAIVDVVIGVMAFAVAAMQVFANDVSTEPLDAWTDEAKETAPVEPAFEIDEVLPPLDGDKQNGIPASSGHTADDMTVDDILRELCGDDYSQK